jgi:DNA gyrase subunit A
VGLRLVRDEDHLMLVTSAGKVIRTPVHGIRVTGRVAQGVCLVRLGDQERVASVERLAEPEDAARPSGIPSQPPPEPPPDLDGELDEVEPTALDGAPPPRDEPSSEEGSE